MIVAVYEVPSAILGAPKRYVGLDDETGEFGLAQTVLIAPGKFSFIGEKMTLSGAIELAGGVLSGDARKVTDPGALRRLAIAFLAAAAKVGQIAVDLRAAEGVAADASEAATEREELRDLLTRLHAHKDELVEAHFPGELVAEWDEAVR